MRGFVKELVHVAGGPPRAEQLTEEGALLWNTNSVSQLRGTGLSNWHIVAIWTILRLLGVLDLIMRQLSKLFIAGGWRSLLTLQITAARASMNIRDKMLIHCAVNERKSFKKRKGMNECCFSSSS